MALRGPAAVLLALGLAACGSEAAPGADSSDASRAGVGVAGDTCPVDPIRIVVTVDQWAGIVGPLAGPCGDVTTIVKGSAGDPHDFEPTPADLAAFEEAELVVINGLGYDHWAENALDALDHEPTVVDAGEVVGLEAGANPHIWYGPGHVRKVAAAVSARLAQLRPAASTDLDAQRAAFDASLAPYDAEIATIAAAAKGKRYGATEPVFDDMAAAVGLVDATPEGYRRAAANETDPGPADVAAFHEALAEKAMDVLIVDVQTEGAIPEQIRAAAEDAGVPVVEVSETMPKGAAGFVDWQVGQLQALRAAFGAR